MKRFNLWIVNDDHAKVICYGSRSEMNTLALGAALTSCAGSQVHVLPDGEEPCLTKLSNS
jgi:hypothetical protein